MAELDSMRNAADISIDSLMKSLSSKDHTRHLNAVEINRLFEDFGTLLDYDRVLSSQLQNTKTQFTSAERLAAAKLLRSAAFYDRSFQHNGRIRRALDRGELGNNIPKNILQKSREFLYSVSVRKKLLNHSAAAKPDAADSILMQLPSTNFMKEAYADFYRKNDRLKNAFYYSFTFAGSVLFNTTEAENRKRRIKKRKTAVQLQAYVHPYDILLSKSNNHMAGKVIPGYFGHVAIWMGDEMPGKGKRVRKFFNADKNKQVGINKKRMEEALRSGVRISSLKDFADGDVFLIMRLRELTPEQQKCIQTNACKQLNKSYDFNFDIESPDKVNCTELIYLSCDFIKWKVSPFMGRYTIFPDDLLKTALSDERFEIVVLLKDGQLIEHPKLTLLNELMK